MGDVFERQVLQKLVRNGESLPCASGTNAENLEAQSAMQHSRRHTVCASQLSGIAGGNAGYCSLRHRKVGRGQKARFFSKDSCSADLCEWKDPTREV